jgi:hypothetical protein
MLTADQQKALAQQLLQQMSRPYRSTDMSSPSPPPTAAPPAAAAAAAEGSVLQQQQQQGVELLWRPSVTNHALFAAVCEAVCGLQLQPDATWVTWCYSNSLALLLQGQQHSSSSNSSTPQQQQQPPKVGFLVATMQLAAYLHKQQQQGADSVTAAGPTAAAAAGVTPSSGWLAAWAAAAAQLQQTFSAKQLLAVTQALQMLQLQLPGSVWARHLDPTAVQGLSGRELLLLLGQLPTQSQQQQQLFPAAWLQAAAEALPAALVGSAAAAASAAAAGGSLSNSEGQQTPSSLSSSLSAAAAGEPPTAAAAATVVMNVLREATVCVQQLVAAGWQGADEAWCQRVWEAVLGWGVATEGSMDHALQQQQQQSAAAAAVGQGQSIERPAGGDGSSKSSGRHVRPAVAGHMQGAGVAPAAAAAASPWLWGHFCDALNAAGEPSQPHHHQQQQQQDSVTWAVALQAVLIYHHRHQQQQQQQQLGDIEGQQPCGLTHPPAMHPLAATSAAGVLVALVHSCTANSSSSSSASVAPLLLHAVRCLAGGVCQLQLRQLLHLVRALVVPLHHHSPQEQHILWTQLKMHQQQQQQQQQKAEGVVEWVVTWCLAEVFPQLATEVVQQVGLGWL